ncbi:MAG: hypothetical protein ACT4NU_05235 [Chromatiales bacterium]
MLLSLPGTGTTAASTASTAKPEIASLLDGAAADVDALRLTAPRGDNAWQKYHQVLQLDPRNRAAQGGIQAIASRYVDLAYSAMAKGELELAGRYLARAEWVSPGEEAVAAARVELGARRRTSPGGARPLPRARATLST